jgi:DUF2075 family protein
LPILLGHCTIILHSKGSGKKPLTIHDWNGVILGADLVWRTDRWVVNRSANKDPDFKNTNKVSDVEFEKLVKNVYKVLLTRGLIGTYVFSVDPETQDFLTHLTGSLVLNL